MATPCLVLSDDLLDSSRITGHARAAGLEAVTCRDSAALLAALDRRPASPCSICTTRGWPSRRSCRRYRRRVCE